jgi:hypothetical protein
VQRSVADYSLRLLDRARLVRVCADSARLLRSAPAVYKNCTALSKRYEHGLGRGNARGKTSDERVGNFKRTRLYRRAMSYNKRLDREKDGIPREKR